MVKKKREHKSCKTCKEWSPKTDVGYCKATQSNLVDSDDHCDLHKEMMAEKKKLFCPLSMASSRDDCEYCLEERCRWWNEGEKNCAIHMLAHYVSAIWEHSYRTDR